QNYQKQNMNDRNVSSSQRIRNGAEYTDLLVVPTTSHLTTATVNDKEKLVFPDSNFAIQLVTNSYKYGEELQFVAWSRQAPVIASRCNQEHEYYRLECGYLPATHETADTLREVADKLDHLIGYSKPAVTIRVLTGKSKIVELLV
ncbi:MAG: hypothetical protein WC325_12395, partial [Candidatus Bathyarchaeia archaeon]